MHTNDSISDMLTRIRNAQALNSFVVEIPFTRVNFDIAKILKHYKFVRDVREVDSSKDAFKRIEIDLIKDRISEISRVSKPGKRVYSESTKLNDKYKYGKGIVIVTTSKGICLLLRLRKKMLEEKFCAKFGNYLCL
jgi:small subunit ribosomal protein S8